ncbi:unnamed protein product [Miscanthus lutarioriparius]|uniref:Peptidase A1 domain-containing protein n=1 Tax=Miscanthus lutarioriparius TaxID=422564 RepID=A0A811MT94_9POAL|nr:unnamed protein product [Miscanthus lutarioriparius]
MHRDRDKATSIHRKIAGASAINAARTSKVVHLPARWATASLGTNNYVVTVGLGTPARHFTVEFDTGSDLSWVQCKPCHDCYEKKDASTFSTVPCGARECRDLGNLRTCSSPGDPCRFEVARDLPSLYFVRLVGVMVAGQAVKVPAARMLVNSGTQRTNLPDSTFAAVWSAFACLMGRYRMPKAKNPLYAFVRKELKRRTCT